MYVFRKRVSQKNNRNNGGLAEYIADERGAMIEQKLRNLFDMQSFVRNSRIEKMAEEANSRYSAELNDDMLDYVSAAGETDDYRATKNSSNKK